jgi:hypothetical protein
MLALRFVIIGLTLLLGLFLIARGSVVIGGIILALAIARVAMAFTWMRRRNEFRARMQARRARAGAQRL